MQKQTADIVLAAGVATIVTLFVMLFVDNIVKGLTASQEDRDPYMEVYNG